jgi:hypothetical protein
MLMRDISMTPGHRPPGVWRRQWRALIKPHNNADDALASRPQVGSPSPTADRGPLMADCALPWPSSGALSVTEFTERPTSNQLNKSLNPNVSTHPYLPSP